MRDLLPGKERAHDIDALGKHGVPLGLLRPGHARYRLVDRLAAAERQPEAAGEHLGQCRRPLRQHRGVIAVSRGGNDADRKTRRLQCSPEPGPGVARLALPLAPGMEVVRRFRFGEAGCLGPLYELQQTARGELLVRRVIADTDHAYSGIAPPRAWLPLASVIGAHRRKGPPTT